MSFSAMRYTEFRAQCDKCEEVEVLYTGDGYGDMTAWNVNDAKRILRATGWCIGKTTLCPNCKK